MTTIAFDGKTVAADTLACRGCQKILQPAEKLRVHKGAIYGVFGGYETFEAWIAWEQAGCDPYKLPIEGSDTKSGLLKFRDEGCVSFHAGAPYAFPIVGPNAWGSGSEYALAALAMGAAAFAAVAIAKQFDPYTGGDIVVYDVKTLERLTPV